MDEGVAFLYKWQTLAGAIIGGIIALLVALLVAHKARRQGDLSAAMLFRQLRAACGREAL